MDDKLKNDELEKDLQDTDDIVAPDRAIFTQVAEKLNKPEKPKGYTATWHGGENEKDDFEVDEMYASTFNADKNFMKAFGLSETGSHKTISNLGKTKETEFAKDNIYSNEYEYTDVNQKKEIIGMYHYATKSILRKLIIATFFCVFLFLQENIFQLSFFDFGGFDYFSMDKHPYIHIIAGLVALFACAICAREQLYHGTRSIFKKDYSPESVATIALLTSVVHTLVSLIFVFVKTEVFAGKIMLLNFPASAVLVASLLYTYFNVRRERFGFSVVASKNSKFVLEKVQESNAEAEFETFTTSVNGEFAGQIARVAKTPFVKNYFANTNSTVYTRKFLKIYYIIALVVPFIIAIVSAFLPSDESGLVRAYIAFVYFFVGLLTVIPVGILFSYSIPFLVANTNLYDSGVSVIGEEAIEEFANVDAIVVNDTTAFPPKNVKIRNALWKI